MGRIKSKDHKDKEWNEALVFVATDGSIDKTKILFLEYLAFEKTKEANLYTLATNIQKPQRPHISESDESTTREFF